MFTRITAPTPANKPNPPFFAIQTFFFNVIFVLIFFLAAIINFLNHYQV